MATGCELGTALFERALQCVQLPTDQDVNLTVACPAPQRFTRIVPIGLSAKHALGLPACNMVEQYSILQGVTVNRRAFANGAPGYLPYRAPPFSQARKPDPGAPNTESQRATMTLGVL